MGITYEDFLDRAYEPVETDLVCEFYIEPAADMSWEAAASPVASESSNGTWAELQVASGGLHPGLMPQLLDALGTRIAVQAGGGVHGHPDGTHAGAKAFRRAVDAAAAGESIHDAAADSPELATALEKWGTDTPRRRSRYAELFVSDEFQLT